MLRIVSQMRYHAICGSQTSLRLCGTPDDTYQVLHHKGEDKITQHPREIAKALCQGHADLLHSNSLHYNGVWRRNQTSILIDGGLGILPTYKGLGNHDHNENNANGRDGLFGNVVPVYRDRPRVLELVHHRRQDDVLVMVC